MNAGAQRANGEMLLFLHADSQLPAGYDEAMQSAWRHAASRATDAPPRCAALRRRGFQISERLQPPLMTFSIPPAGGAALRASSWAAQARHYGGGWCAMACGGEQGLLGRPTATRPSLWTATLSGPRCADAGHDMSIRGGKHTLGGVDAGVLDEWHDIAAAAVTADMALARCAMPLQRHRRLPGLASAGGRRVDGATAQAERPSRSATASHSISTAMGPPGSIADVSPKSVHLVCLEMRYTAR